MGSNFAKIWQVTNDNIFVICFSGICTRKVLMLYL